MQPILLLNHLKRIYFGVSDKDPKSGLSNEICTSGRLFWKSERFPVHTKCCHLCLWAETFKQWHIQMDIVMFQIQLKILFWKSEWFPFHVCSISKQELWNNDTSDWERISRWILFMFQIQRICSRHLLKSSSSSTLFIHSQIRNLKSHLVWVWSHDVALNSLPCSAVIPVKQQRLKLVRGGLLKMGASDSRSDGRFFLWCSGADESTASQSDSGSLLQRVWCLVFSVGFTPGRLCEQKPVERPDSGTNGLFSVSAPGFWCEIIF